MRRTHVAFGLALAGLIAGCGREPEAVYVDLSRIPAQPMEAATASPPQPPGERHGDVVATVPAVPPQDLMLAANERRLQVALDAIAENRRLAESNVHARLERALLADVKLLEAERERALDPEHQRLLDDTYLALRDVFEKYARQRFMPQIELAMRVGWPDPDPGSKRGAPARVREIREQLAGLDLDYAAERDQLLARAFDKIDADLATLRVEIARLETEALERAAREAADRARAEEVDALERTPLRQNVRLPAMPEVRTEVYGEPPPLAAPTPTAPDFRVVDRQLLMAEARLFVAEMGYRLVTSSDVGRDATEEFQRWRKQLPAGR